MIEARQWNATADGSGAMRATAGALGSLPAKDAQAAAILGSRRRRLNVVVEILCVLATAIGVLLLASILFTLFWRGLAGFSLAVFTQNDEATRLGRRTAERDRRQPDPDRARDR